MENPAQGGICKNLVDSIKKNMKKNFFTHILKKHVIFLHFR